nr:hypothetical protein [Desulfobacula sp.]
MRTDPDKVSANHLGIGGKHQGEGGKKKISPAMSNDFCSFLMIDLLDIFSLVLFFFKDKGSVMTTSLRNLWYFLLYRGRPKGYSLVDVSMGIISYSSLG